VDALSLLCPLPILRLAAAVRRAEPGDLIELVGDDEGLLEDLPAWCEGERHELLSMVHETAGRIVGRVRKRGA
jgi:tRNA 2-thiouridine synthesizing protein A